MLTFIPEENSNRKSSQEKPARYYTVDWAFCNVKSFEVKIFKIH
jgi:hypothetical protein